MLGRKVITVGIVCVGMLALTAGPALAEGECEPPPPPPTCTEIGQGWEGELYLRTDAPVTGAVLGTYFVRVFGEVGCTPITVETFKAIAKRYIRTGSVAKVADPEVWTVEVLGTPFGGVPSR